MQNTTPIPIQNEWKTQSTIQTVMKANCCHCGQSLAYNGEDAGRRIKCPRCSNPFLLPGGESQLEIYQPSRQSLQCSGPPPLPEEIAVELAEERVYSQRESRIQQRERFQWEREERQFNSPAVMGAAINATVLLALVCAMLFHDKAKGFLLFVTMIGSLSAMFATGMSIFGVCRQKETTEIAWAGAACGAILMFVLPLAWSLVK